MVHETLHRLDSAYASNVFRLGMLEVAKDEGGREFYFYGGWQICLERRKAVEEMKDFARSAKDTDHVVLHGGVAFSCHMNVALLASCINECARLWLQEETKPLVNLLEEVRPRIMHHAVSGCLACRVSEALAAWKSKEDVANGQR